MKTQNRVYTITEDEKARLNDTLTRYYGTLDPGMLDRAVQEYQRCRTYLRRDRG